MLSDILSPYIVYIAVFIRAMYLCKRDVVQVVQQPCILIRMANVCESKKFAQAETSNSKSMHEPAKLLTAQHFAF